MQHYGDLCNTIAKVNYSYHKDYLKGKRNSKILLNNHINKHIILLLDKKEVLITSLEGFRVNIYNFFKKSNLSFFYQKVGAIGPLKLGKLFLQKKLSIMNIGNKKSKTYT